MERADLCTTGLFVATLPTTEVWLGDDRGHFVQEGFGTLRTSLLAGEYTVEFGLGTAPYPIRLDRAAGRPRSGHGGVVRPLADFGRGARPRSTAIGGPGGVVDGIADSRARIRQVPGTGSST